MNVAHEMFMLIYQTHVENKKQEKIDIVWVLTLSIKLF